jgi:hypothetical protein
VSFFEPPPPPEPITPEEFEVPEWYGPPQGVLGGVVPLELLLARSDKAAVVIESATVYPTGMEFVIDVRWQERSEEWLFPEGFERRRRRAGGAWAKENLARAKQTLPNGYCGLPLQQRCPHPNACLTCDSFLTTAEFLPAHRDQLHRTEQLIAQAQADGRQRLVEINEPVRLNLIRIIDGLEGLEDADGR